MASAEQATAADPHNMEEAAEIILSYIYDNLPDFPLYNGARLAALPAARRADHISRLPGDILRNIVARLPVKEAARTAALSSRWRALWRSTPLVLVDIHLLPKARAFRPTPADSPAVTSAVSRILEAHPGPFSCVHLICSRMKAYKPQLARWLQLLAAKGVQDLVVVNRPLPLDVPLPASLFTIATLTRLYVGIWKLPGTAALRGASFPHLRELGLYFVQMEHGVVDSLVARSPVLEVLNIMGCINGGLRLRVVSKTLRLRIGDAPSLHTLGYLEPGQVLELQGTVIMPGIRPSQSAMLTGVKILSLDVCFGVRNDVKMVPTFLKCFPNAERLHIVSKKCDEPTGEPLTVKFWEESGPIENVVSRINVLTFREFKGDRGEAGFVEYVFQSARALEVAAIFMANPSFTRFSTDEALVRVQYSARNLTSTSCKKCVIWSSRPEGGDPWSLRVGADFSLEDPFMVIEEDN
ncbi:putative FBD-associated F-box protein At5g56700 isoform X2 [Hordeum vulgare subsp. vulgare]|uniref:putative FBD-associated F-box protein At5g56700 isoform X2 n=1 Tax=Hordeum vulgare subsp. vulgare TaxID=112509 RepID=UPI001B8531E2|nr:putative FBD-associated F-box protein At5g56700 isoform X2 [Hordeum vulgare subsp. vulgare]